jgi:hypothetical protein
MSSISPNTLAAMGRSMRTAANLKTAKREIKCSKSIVWRDVVSLYEGDAARLGYITRETWEDAFRRTMPASHVSKFGLFYGRN